VRVVDFDSEYILTPELQVRREVIEERNVSVRTFAEKLAIDPHLAKLVNPIEFDGELFVFVRIWQAESLSIPTNASGKICAARTGWFFFVERPFDTPIVRQIQSSPVCVGKVRHFSPRKVALAKLPAWVKTFPDSRFQAFRTSAGKGRTDGWGH
jgi:hypothetical protein